jgi:hypothetical protein
MQKNEMWFERLQKNVWKQTVTREPAALLSIRPGFFFFLFSISVVVNGILFFYLFVLCFDDLISQFVIPTRHAP